MRQSRPARAAILPGATSCEQCILCWKAAEYSGGNVEIKQVSREHSFLPSSLLPMLRSCRGVTFAASRTRRATVENIGDFALIPGDAPLAVPLSVPPLYCRCSPVEGGGMDRPTANFLFI